MWEHRLEQRKQQKQQEGREWLGQMEKKERVQIQERVSGAGV